MLETRSNPCYVTPQNLISSSKLLAYHMSNVKMHLKMGISMDPQKDTIASKQCAVDKVEAFLDLASHEHAKVDRHSKLPRR